MYSQGMSVKSKKKKGVCAKADGKNIVYMYCTVNTAITIMAS